MRYPCLLAALGLAVGAGCRSPSAASAEAPPLDLAARVTQHGFPAIFQAWSPIEGFNHAPAPATPLAEQEDSLQSLARHDLVFLSLGQCGLVPDDRQHEGLSEGFTPESVPRARALKARLRAANPHAVLLAEIRYHDAPGAYLPEDSPWWLRDREGRRVPKTRGTVLQGYFMLNFAEPGWQEQVANLCAAAVATGAVDGCMLDWFSDDDAAHAALAQKIREKLGDRGLLIVNVNGHVPSRSAPYLNGMYMEGFGASFFSDWREAVRNLQWAPSHLRAPAFTALELWYPAGTAPGPASGRNDLARMRMVTTLALCNSNGYVLYSPAPGHAHDWYAFWTPDLGRPIGVIGRVEPNHAYSRKFEHGTVWFNPPGNGAITVEFPGAMIRKSTGERGERFVIPAGDGDIFLSEGAGSP